MNIRKATINDLDQIVELGDLMLDFHYDYDPYYKIYSEFENSRDFYKEHLEKNGVYYVVAEDKNGVLIGYASASITSLDDSDAPKICHFIANYIWEAYREKGIGTQLFDACMEWAQKNDVKHLELNVDARNLYAINMWKQFGFKDYQVILKKDL